MHWDTLKQDNYSTVRGDGGSRVGEVRAGTTSPMPEHKGIKLQYLSETPSTPAAGPGSLSVNILSVQNLIECTWNVLFSNCCCQYFQIKSLSSTLGEVRTHRTHDL